MPTEELVTQLARQVQQKFYGKYRGFVADNRDPERRARLRVRVPSVLGEETTGWALPALAFGGLPDQGWFCVPELDAQLWVEFEEGEVSRPIWTGTFWQQSGDAPAEAALEDPTTRIFKTGKQHILQFDDADDNERILLMHPKQASLEIDKNGTIILTDAKGSTIVMDADANELKIDDANGNTLIMSSAGTTIEDANGNRIEMAAAGVTVKGTQIVVEGDTVMVGGQGGEPLIKGTTFLTLFATHVHPTGVGPSGPPIPQGEMNSLSMKVTCA